MPIVQCSHCKEDVKKTQWEINRAKNSFCSVKCSDELKLAQRPVYKCEQCGEVFPRKKSIAKKADHLFCSNKCKFEYNKNHIKTKCDHCNEEIEIPMHLYNKYEKHYCDTKCMGLDKETKVIVKCDCCGIDFDVIPFKLTYNEKHYCSNECRYKAQDTSVETVCACCEEPIRKTKGSMELYDKHYCNKKCQMKHMNLIRLDVSDWEFYEEYMKLRRKLTWTQNFKNWRKEVLEDAKRQCNECGSGDDLHVHHIASLYSICKKYGFDYVAIKNSSEFNDIKNGKCLCSKCHEGIHCAS